MIVRKLKSAVCHEEEMTRTLYKHAYTCIETVIKIDRYCACMCARERESERRKESR